MPAEPGVKRTHAFVDGQNLFYAAKEAFRIGAGSTEPNGFRSTARLMIRAWTRMAIGRRFHDREPFEEKMKRLTAPLEEQFAEGRRLEEEIRKNLKHFEISS